MNRQKAPRSARAVAAIASLAAGALLLASAFMTLLLGVSALATNELLAVEPGWTFRLNATVWGWIHIALGIAMALGGIAVMFRWVWARIAAIALAVASMVLFFVWLPYYPVWSAIVIAVDLVIIWAVATWDTPASQPPAD